MIIPLLVRIFIAVGRLLFISIVKGLYFLVRMEAKHESIIAEILLVIVTVTALVCELTLAVGLDLLRSDIWVRNFAKSLTPRMTFMNAVFAILQICIVYLLKKTSVDTNPKRHRILKNIAKPEIEILMVTSKKIKIILLGPSNASKKTDSIRVIGIVRASAFWIICLLSNFIL